MSIEINKLKCVSCGRCRDVCPGTLIALDIDKRAYIKYPRDCWGCTSCIKECPVYAIRFFLGADMGGMGSRLHTEKQGDILRWIIEKPDGSAVAVNVDTRESNKY
ncbi:MAG: ferredoxin family protein [Ruminiclostridium sp.]|nr:ferredoxin family protein [Ruminiclostridium sp.]